jgi:hypothetical protein
MCLSRGDDEKTLAGRSKLELPTLLTVQVISNVVRDSGGCSSVHGLMAFFNVSHGRCH